MTINSPASVLWAMYLVVAEKQGADWKKLSGTLQNDILKEYIAQKEYIYPPRAFDAPGDGHHRVRFQRLRRGSTPFRSADTTFARPARPPLQELAFTLCDGIEYVEWALRRGLDVDDFAPRLSFFFNAHNDFFEEIAKYRAARKIWYQVMRDRFQAKNERSRLLRFHTQTAGVSLTAQQPMNNIVRAALQAMAAVLGGTQSLHTNSYDEAFALPTEEAARIALRTQQIIAYESGVTQTVDPLGGSYFLEALTLQMEKGAFDYFGKLDAMGGMVKAIERGYPQKEVAEALVPIPARRRSQGKNHCGSERVCGRGRTTAYAVHRRKRGPASIGQAQGLARTPVKRRSPAVPGRFEKSRCPRAAIVRKWRHLVSQYHALHRGRGAGLRDGWRNLRSPPRSFRNLHRSERHLVFACEIVWSVGRAPSPACCA